MQVHGYSNHAVGQQSLSPQQRNGGPDKTVPASSPAPAPVDTVTLSDQAQAALNTETETTRGKSASSPAHRARALLAEQQALGATSEGVNFGTLVSRLARGIDTADLFTPPAEEDTTVATATETTPPEEI